MAISLKNHLLSAENSDSITVEHPDGSTSTKPFHQRSFGYGQGAGNFQFDSEPPFIINDFNGNPLPGVEQNPNSSTADVVDEVTNNFVRGGVVTLGKRALKDFERFGKVIFSPSGLAWTAAQLALARTNPSGPIPEADPESAKNPDKGALIQGIQGAAQKLKNKFPRNQVSLPIGTGLTVGTGAAGIRFRKDGLADLTIESGHSYDPNRGGAKYDNITTSNAKEISEKATESNKNYNRLLNLYGKNQLLLDPSINSVSDDPNFLLDYGGGAHSFFGIGRTRIKKYRSNPYNDIGDNGGYLPLFNQKLFSLRQGSNPTKANSGTSGYTDYKTVRDLPNQVKQTDHLKKIISRSTRIGLYKMGDPGIKMDNGDGYGAYNSSTIDKISAANIFKRLSPDESFEGEFKDYIKFRIAVVDSENPLNDNVILFRALLDNVADNFSGDWNSYKYNGRAEKFYTYAGFDRSITFGFKIHTQTRWEQKPLWRKLNYLVAQTAPEYKNRRMRGVFSRLTIGDWMNEIPGFFTSVNLSWSTAYPWEIRQDSEGADKNLNEYPHILDVSCNFQPVHNFAPSNSPTTPFLLPEIGVNNNRKYARTTDDEASLSAFGTDIVAKNAKFAYYDDDESAADAAALEAENALSLEAEEDEFDDEFLNEEFSLD